MFIYRGTYSPTLSVFDFTIIFCDKLHNLKCLDGSKKITKQCMRVKSVSDRTVEANSKIPDMSKLNRNNDLFSTTERRSPSGSDRISCVGGSAGVSRVHGERNTWRKHTGESIDVKNDDKFNNVSVKQNSDQNKQSKRQCNNIYMYNNPAFVSQTNQHRNFYPFTSQDFVYSINYGINVAPSYLPQRVFYHSLSETSVPHQNLSNVCFNSRENHNSSRQKHKLNRASSAAKVSNVSRSWELTSLGKILERMKGGKSPGVTFKIMSYNVLAQDLLDEHPELYRDNEKKALQWEYRWRKLFEEIKQHNCEIICLQEVQQNHIEQYYHVLKSLGYTGIYKQRTGPKTDGCAIYYKKDVLNLIEDTSVEYRQPNIPLLDRDNVAIIAVFSPKANTSAQFVVATTHLLYNPRRQDIRLAQTQVLLTEIERIAYRGFENGTYEYLPIVITGDLNSTPNSAVCQFITSGRLKYDDISLRSNLKYTGKVLIPSSLRITDQCQHAALLDLRENNLKISRSEELKLIALQNSDRSHAATKISSNLTENKFSTGVLSHNLSLKSVYNHKIKGDSEGTTFQDEWITVDYIYYSGMQDGKGKVKDNKLKLLSRYILPTKRQLNFVRIPNLELGSDHLALLAKFKLEYN